MAREAHDTSGRGGAKGGHENFRPGLFKMGFQGPLEWSFLGMLITGGNSLENLGLREVK